MSHPGGAHSLMQHSGKSSAKSTQPYVILLEASFLKTIHFKCKIMNLIILFYIFICSEFDHFKSAFLFPNFHFYADFVVDVAEQLPS